MRKIKYLLAMLAGLSFSLQLQAQSNISERARNVVSNNIEKNQAYIQSTAAVRDSETTQNSSPTINDGAKTARNSQSSGQMLNMIASAGLFAACLASCPKCRMELCAMGALAAMQGAHDGGAANASNATYDISKFTPEEINPAGDNGGGNFHLDPSIQEGSDKLKEAGYKVSEKGVVFPDGTFQPSSAFSSPEAMAAAGMSPQSAALAGDVLGAINSELNKISGLAGDGASVSSMAVDSASGGYASGGGGSGDYDDGGFGYSLQKLKNPFDGKDSKKLLAGKSLMVGGEPIGVKGDNLFEMVHRAYQNKRKKDQFQESTGARLPASRSAGKGL